MKIENYDKATELVKEINNLKKLLTNLNQWCISIGLNHLPQHQYLEIQQGVNGEYNAIADNFISEIKNQI